MSDKIHLTVGYRDLVFGFIYQPSSELSRRPLRYQRCDIDYGGEAIASGVIRDVRDYDGGGWNLTIVVGPPEDVKEIGLAIERGDIAVRIVG